MSGRAPGLAPAYRGRFAPSPTGLLHFGSLLAAVASYADARAHAGTWLVRIEDVDRTREVPGAAERILSTLKSFGMTWDEPPVYQRRRTQAYAEALSRLQDQGLCYACGCSRAEIARTARVGLEGPIYPGTCRNGLTADQRPRSIRLRTGPTAVRFTDRIQGEQEQCVEQSLGDFVLRRADGLHAYQLAVVVDDAWQGITQVVRGADLLLSTPRQCLLQAALGLPRPGYAHIPIVLDAQGRKLSKSLAAAPLDPGDPLPALRLAWDFLGQRPLLDAASPAAFWEQAVSLWRIQDVPRLAGARLGEPKPWEAPPGLAKARD